MAGEINRVPHGLLSILDMKARGQNPRTLDSNLQIGIDAFELYALEDRVRITGQAGPITAVGQFADSSTDPATGAPFTRVPPGEVWYCWGLTCFPTAALNGAGGQLRFSAGILGTGGFPNYQGLASSTFQASGGDFPVAASSRPFWMRQNDIVSLLVEEYVAFTVDPSIVLSVIATRYRV